MFSTISPHSPRFSNHFRKPESKQQFFGVNVVVFTLYQKYALGDNNNNNKKCLGDEEEKATLVDDLHLCFTHLPPLSPNFSTHSAYVRVRVCFPMLGFTHSNKVCWVLVLCVCVCTEFVLICCYVFAAAAMRFCVFISFCVLPTLSKKNLEVEKTHELKQNRVGKRERSRKALSLSLFLSFSRYLPSLFVTFLSFNVFIVVPTFPNW